MFRALIRRDDEFFDIFDRVSAKIVEGTEVLDSMFREPGSVEWRAQRLKAIEHEADDMVHRTLERLHRTFITPIDREDIHKLAVRLDDILDMTDAAGGRLALYQPREIPREGPELTRILLDSAHRIQEMVGLLRRLRKPEGIRKIAVEVNRLENDADVVCRSAIVRMLKEQKDPFEFIKWKEILEYIEESTDRCEDVADIIEGIVLQNS